MNTWISSRIHPIIVVDHAVVYIILWSLKSGSLWRCNFPWVAVLCALRGGHALAFVGTRTVEAWWHEGDSLHRRAGTRRKRNLTLLSSTTPPLQKVSTITRTSSKIMRKSYTVEKLFSPGQFSAEQHDFKSNCPFKPLTEASVHRRIPAEPVTSQRISYSELFSPAPLAVKMPETAEAVSATLTTNRNCTIEITNVSGSYCLINPK